MSSEQTCIVVGASHAGSQLAVQLRKEGWQGRIVLVGNEKVLPYHRPPLSKAVLAGEKSVDSILLRPPAVYETNTIELELGKELTQINPKQQSVVLRTGDGEETRRYDKLALCLGATVCRIPMGDGLAGVFYLRQAADVEQIQAWLSEGPRKAVVIGAGYIGLETAAVLAGKGMQVTVLEMMDRVLERVASEALSNYVEALHQEHGVTVVTGARVSGISGEKQVESVLCEDGSHYEADIVLIGAGILPNTAIATAAGLAIENGIVVDEYARTSDANIVAAGDCSNHPSLLYHCNVRLESVQNANDQAKTAAATLCDKQVPYAALPWFWSDQYDSKIQMAGLHAGFDEMLVRGNTSVEGGNFVIFYLKAGRIIAADAVNRPKEFLACKTLVKNGLQTEIETPAHDALTDSKNLKDLLVQ